MMPMHWIRIVVLACACSPALAAEDMPPTITAKDAAAHVGEEVVLQMQVKSGRLLPQRKTCFLNSEKDYRSAKNVAIFINAATLDKLADQGIAEPHEHFAKKTVAVKGRLQLFNKQPQIQLDDPMNISIVEVPSP